MPLSRRQFLKWAGATGIGAVVFNGCTVPQEEIKVQSSLELPEDLVTGRDNYYATTSQGLGSSEGILVRVMEGRAKKVEGNPDYPLNADPSGGSLGRHGLRTEALLQELYHPDRISQPMVRTGKGGPFRRIGWPEALQRLKDVLETSDPNKTRLITPPIRGAIAKVATAFSEAHGSKLLSFEPLDEAPLYKAIHDVFGEKALPDFDIANSGTILSFGSDFLGTWGSPTHFAGGYGEFRQGKNRSHRGYLVQFESRFSLTAASADDWVYVHPGTEGLVAMAIAYVIIDEGLAGNDIVSKLTGGRGLNAYSGFRPGDVANATGVSAERIIKIAKAFADSHNGPALAIGGGSAGAHTNGTEALRAIYALNHLVGSVNKAGGVILNSATNVTRISPSSLKEWRSELELMKSGDIETILVRDANPIYGLPGELDASSTISNVPNIVSFSSFPDETTAIADLVLPGHTTLEDWGSDTPDPGPGFTSVGFQQPVVRRFRDTMGFGDVLLQTGKDLGLESQLPWTTMRDVVREEAKAFHQRSSGSVQALTFEEFWKKTLERGGWWDLKDRPASSAKIPRIPTLLPNAKFGSNTKSFPFTLVPFESLALGKGDLAHLPWLQATADPLTTVAWQTWVEINPKTAEKLDLKFENIVVVESSTGKYIQAAIYVNPACPPDIVGVPFGQGHKEFTSYASGRGANVFEILRAAEDASTGAFAWASTKVRLAKTNKRSKLPSLEGIVPAVQLDDQKIIEILPLGSHH